MKESEAEEKAWQTILETIRKEFPGKEGTNYQTVPRGDIMRLIARVEDAYPDKEKEAAKKEKSEKASSEKTAKQSRKAKEDTKEGGQNNQKGREAS